MSSILIPIVRENLLTRVFGKGQVYQPFLFVRGSFLCRHLWMVPPYLFFSLSTRTKNFSFCENKCHKKFMKRIFFLTSRTTNYYEFLHKQLWHLVSLANLLHNECILHQTILHFHWKVQKHSGVTWNFCNLQNPYKWGYLCPWGWWNKVGICAVRSSHFR